MQTPATMIPEAMTILSPIHSFFVFGMAAVCAALWAFIQFIRVPHTWVHTTRLRGPPSQSFVYGVGKAFMEAPDPSALYESWAKEYGVAYEMPLVLGERRIVLFDPKAIAHFHSNDTWTFVRTPAVKKAIENWFGRGLSWADGESHRRQRKSLTPAFSVAAIRNLTSIYYNSAYKTKSVWDSLIESSGQDCAIIEVQHWMNYISLDTIGQAGFSYDFGALDGKRASVTQVFDALGSSLSNSTLHIFVRLLSQAFPFLVTLPTSRTRLIFEMSNAMEEILNILMARTKKEFDIDAVDEKGEKSIIGLLIKGGNANSEFQLSKGEVLAQMKVLLLAGYETTSISMTWALIELSRNPNIQTRLRSELLDYGTDPTYDQLANSLPYLDAVVHEIFRLHAPVRDIMRMAGEDTVIPLSEPVRTKSGQVTETLYIAKGTIVIIPFESVNRSDSIWGEDAKTFKPDRWLPDGHGDTQIPAKAREVVGHRHLLTFGDGPRTCIGKLFAITEFKAVLSVLIKNFVFELPDGVETRIETDRGFLPRPHVAGEAGCQVPLLVKPYVG